MSTTVEASVLDLAGRLALIDDVAAVCLLGSTARGDAEPESDIDLLALVGPGGDPRAVRRDLPRRLDRRRVQTKVVDEARLDEILRSRSTFAVHLLREAIITHDEEHRLARICGRHPADAPVRADAAALRRRLEPYEDLGWCQGLYLYCLADCYSTGRAAAYAWLGTRGVFEFAAPKALVRLGALQPAMKAAAENIAQLRPFFVLANRDVRRELPFHYRDCHAETEAAVAAAECLVEALEHAPHG